MSDQLTTIAIAVMVAISIGGIAWVFLYPILSGQHRASKRIETIAVRNTSRIVREARQSDADKRRKQLLESLGEKEKSRRRRLSISARIAQAGLKWSETTFYIVSAFSGGMAFLLALLFGAPLYVAPMLAFSAAIGLPIWPLKMLKSRREKMFLLEFANSIDIIVRGVKAGLPIGDCFQIIAREAQEPVRGEFGRIVETQALGLPLADCVDKLYERMPLAEVNFFAIVIGIQQQSGGNLAESLSNLSKVLRDRKKMKAKVQAMSQEAKASAAIIGSLPLIVMALIFITSPDYISMLWTEDMGHIMLAGSALWMLAGVFVMRQMINFEI